MQDRYVGDVGDFGKYGLLRRLCGFFAEGRRLRLAVVWCLYPDEAHNSDGRHVGYLAKDSLRQLDPALFDRLKGIVSANDRRVAAIEAADVFPAGTEFISHPLPTASNGRLSPPDRERQRGEWVHACLAGTQACDLVFFDPDNGIEVSSVGKQHAKAGKYIFWDELDPFVVRGQSLVVYHHLNRTASALAQIKALSGKFHSRYPDAKRIIPLLFRRGSCRVFWMVLQPPIADFVEGRIDEMMRSGWSGHFEIAIIP